MFNQLELQILVSMLRAIAESSDPTDLALLQLLTQQQKIQFWAIVPVELRQDIHLLKKQAA